MLRALIFILLLNGLSNALACGDIDHPRPLDVVGKNANDLLQRRAFDELDKLANEYRTTNALSTDGQPKLIGFYAGLARSGNGCRSSSESNTVWIAHKKLLSAWKQASRQSEVPELTLALFEASYAWKARGTGYASTVTEEGWKLFKERIANSRTLLEKMGPVARKDPEWYSAMLDVALAQGWKPEEFEALYQKAVSQFPYYYSYYFTKGAFYSARWHGSPQQFKAFVEESVKATEAKIGQSMYARLHWSASDPSMFRNGQTDWMRMKQGFERIIQDFPDNWNHNNFAKFACMVGDPATLKKQLDTIGKHVSLTAWNGRSYFDACKEFLETEATLRKRRGY